MRFKTPIYLLLILALAAAACNLPFLSRGPQQRSAPEPSKPLAEPTLEGDAIETIRQESPVDLETEVPTETEGQPTIDLLIENALAQRSVRILLEVTEPTGRVSSTSAEIDAKGNQHLKIRYPEGSPSLYGEEAGSPPVEIEIFAIDGTVYTTDSRDEEKLQKTGPELAGKLEQILNGAEGVGLWLRILPEGSLKREGAEQRGGFQAQGFSVHGDINGEIITGEIWIDQGSNGLICANLNVPASLTSYGVSGTGDLLIRYTMEKTSLSPIEIDPARVASDDIAGPDLPAEGSFPGAAGDFPEDFPVYPGAAVQTEETDLRIYQADADIETVKSFYEDELPGNGWEAGEEFESTGTFMKEWHRGGVEIMITITPISADTCMLVVTCLTCE